MLQTVDPRRFDVILFEDNLLDAAALGRIEQRLSAAGHRRSSQLQVLRSRVYVCNSTVAHERLIPIHSSILGKSAKQLYYELHHANLAPQQLPAPPRSLPLAHFAKVLAEADAAAEVRVLENTTTGRNALL